MAKDTLSPEQLLAAKNILNVCAGNTCRSPMFSRRMADQFAERGLTAHIESAGYLPEAGDGLPHNEEWDAIRGEIDVDLSGHRSRRLDQVGGLAKFDLVICMSNSAFKAVMDMERPETTTVVMVCEDGLPDPYKLGTDEYRKCYRRIEEILGELLG